jgi:hypothetical protein
MVYASPGTARRGKKKKNGSMSEEKEERLGE